MTTSPLLSAAALALAGTLAFGCSGTSSAPPSSSPQASATTAAAPPAPAEAKRLTSMLVGAWKGTGTLTVEGKPVALDLELSCAATASSWGVTCQARGVDPSGKLHEETHLWGYSAETAKVHFFAVTTDGDVHDHVGAFTDKGIAVAYTGTMEGKPYVEALSFESTATDTVHFKNETTVGGAAFMGLDMTFKR